MLVGPGRPVSPYRADWSAAVIEKAAQGQPYTFHVNPKSLPSAYIYIKDAAQALIDLKRAPGSKLRQRVYNTHGFMATLTDLVNTIKKYIPDAQITFDWNQGSETKVVSRGFHFEMDNTAAYEDFGYKPRYLLDEMVKDFINSVR